MCNVDRPSKAEQADESLNRVEASGVFGDPQLFKCTDSNVVLVSTTDKPILTEVGIHEKTDWQKLWFDTDDCAFIRFKDDATRQSFKDWVKENAVDWEQVDTTEGQTRIEWSFYRKLTREMDLGERGTGFARERNVSIRTDDPSTPGGDAYKHRLWLQNPIISVINLASDQDHQAYLHHDARGSNDGSVHPNPVFESRPLVEELSETYQLRSVEICPLADDTLNAGRRGRKRPQYTEEYVDSAIDVDIQRFWSHGRAIGPAVRGHPATYPLVSLGRVVWVCDLTGPKDGFEGVYYGFVFRMLSVNSIYYIPTNKREQTDLAHAINRWTIQDNNADTPKLLIMDREQAIRRGWENSNNPLLLALCVAKGITLQLAIPDKKCKPAESAISLIDTLTQEIKIRSNLHRRHHHRLAQLAAARYEISKGRIGSATNVCVAEIEPGVLCWCILTRAQRDSIRLPRDYPRALLFIPVSFDETSVWGVYGELILPHKRTIMITNVSWGQLRWSSTMAYGLQRWGGVYRRISYVDNVHDVLPLPDLGWQDGDDGQDEDMEDDDDSIELHDGPEEFRIDIDTDMGDGEEQDDSLILDPEDNSIDE